MAIGAITKPTISADFTVSNKKSRTRNVQLTAGANYTTGGETVPLSSAGLRQRIESVSSTGQARTTSGGAATIPVSVSFQTDGTVKLQAYVAATGAEQSASADLSTFSIRLTFVGV